MSKLAFFPLLSVVRGSGILTLLVTLMGEGHILTATHQ